MSQGPGEATEGCRPAGGRGHRAQGDGTLTHRRAAPVRRLQNTNRKSYLVSQGPGEATQ